MNVTRLSSRILLVGLVLLCLCSRAPGQESLEALEEQAFKRAVARAEPSLVQIETIGGLDRVAGSVGRAAATTGIIVSADGAVLTSAFAFASEPSSILVRLGDGRRFPARRIATDHVRMLTLLQVDASGLTPMTAAPAEETRVGQWALAVGRTLDLETPAVSVGIVSARNRIWGKAIQTDAKVSPVNYGGALLDVQGRALGILVPLSPSSTSATAGVEWYDSGIGFAIPMEDASRAAGRLSRGEDLKRGLLGVTFSTRALYGSAPQLDRIRYDSPAEKAGLKREDVITSVDDQKVQRVAQVRHALGNKYAGDQIEITVMRGEEELSRQLELVDELPPYEAGFLGVLAQRPQADEAAVDGVRIRFVFPDSPAAQAGLRVGDRITHLAEQAVADTDVLTDLVGRVRPGTEVTISLQRDGQESTKSVVLAVTPTTTPADVPAPPIVPAENPPEGVSVGRYTEMFDTHEQEFWAWVPEDYNPAFEYALMVWLHPRGDTMEARILEEWRSLCTQRGIIILAPKAKNATGWTPNETVFVKDTIELMKERYSIDDQRVFIHAYSTASRIAFETTFKYRELIRGAAIVGGGLTAPPPENRPEFRLQLHLTCGDRDPAAGRVRATVSGLRSMKYPVTFSRIPGQGREYPAADQIDAISRWVECLDRI